MVYFIDTVTMAYGALAGSNNTGKAMLV